MNAKPTVLAAAVLIALGGVATLTGCNKEATASSAPGTEAKIREVANVNGQALTEADLTPYLLQGADRAVATDRAINKAVAAELAEKEFPKEAKAAIAAAQRDVAAQVYLTKKAEQIAKSLTDKDLQERYDVLVKDADFNAYKVKVGAFASEQEALEARERAIRGDRDDKKFQSLGNNGGYISRGDLPYDLGVIVAKMKAGDYSAPVATRNGILVLHLAEVKKNDRPKFEDVKQQLTAALVQERVGQALTSAREGAKITLK